MRYFILTILFLAAGVVSAATVYDGNLSINYESETSQRQKVVYNAYNNYWLTSEAGQDVYRGSVSIWVGGEDELIYELFQVGGTWSTVLENTSLWQTVRLPDLATMKGAKPTYALRVSDNVNEPNLLFRSYRDDVYQTAFAYAGNSTVNFTTGNTSDPADKTAQFRFGSPLPTPVVTLLIALGFGAAFMMYRNRKQVKA